MIETDQCNLNWNDQKVYKDLLKLSGITAGSEHEKVLVAETLLLDGTLDVSLINDFVPLAGQAFVLLDWGTRSGTFSSISLPVHGLATDYFLPCLQALSENKPL